MTTRLRANSLGALVSLVFVSTGFAQGPSGDASPNPPTLCVKTCPSGSATTTTPTTHAATGVKWHPGTYVWVGGISNPEGTSQILSGLSAICTNTNITGIQVVLKWVVLESTAAGDYSKGFAVVDSILQKARSCNKRVMVQIAERIFGSWDTTPTVDRLASSTYPAYLATSTFGTCCGVLDKTGSELQFGGVVTALAGKDFSGQFSIARLWDPVVMDRMIALSKAYAARYDNDPYFEMLSLGESAVGAYPSLSLSALYEQLKRFHAESAQAWPHTQSRMNLNFTAGDPSMRDLIDYCRSLKNCVVGGPDPELPLPNITRPIQANRVFRGAECDGCALTDYRGSLAWVGEQQWFGLDVSWRLAPSMLAAYQRDTMRNSYMIWPNNSSRWSEVLAQINADHSVATLACPRNFGSCDTN